MTTMRIGKHLVRYGTPADQGFLLEPFLRTYDCLVLNATMVAHIPSALASFVTQRAKGKPYVIDPQVHAFQHDTSHLESSSEKSQGEIRRSIRALIARYGEPLASKVGRDRQPLLPGDFKSAKTRREFCRRVLEFQEEALRREIQDSDAAKYYAFLAKKGRTFTEQGPVALVAPYFFLLPSTIDQWLPRNLEFLDLTVEMANAKGKQCAAQLVLSQSLLVDRPLRTTLVEQYRRHAQPSMFLLWIDEFSETEAGADGLRAYVDLLRQLTELAPVVSLYGGFFTVALMKLGLIPRLAGVTHGLEYGEERGVVPVGGGIPMAKFYLPALHTRLPFRDAVRAVRALGGMASPAVFHSKVCDCAECKAVVRGQPDEDFAEYGRTRPVTFMRRNQLVGLEYPLSETKQRCVRHYMWCKEREYAKALALDQLTTDLDRARRTLERVLGLERVAHCGNWTTVLREADQA